MYSHDDPLYTLVAMSDTPTLYQAVTSTYRIRQVLHATASDHPKPRTKTLCGRKVEQGNGQPFDRTQDGVCKVCVKTIAVKERAHPGFEL
jgi:hypothetical protein